MGSVTSLEPSQTVLNCSGTGNSFCRTEEIIFTGKSVWKRKDWAHSNTHKFIIILWYEDVHLGALGADDVTVEGLLAQVDLAALGLVDGNGGDFSQNLQENIQQKRSGTRRSLHTFKTFRNIIDIFISNVGFTRWVKLLYI